jgi:hypothetical protein
LNRWNSLVGRKQVGSDCQDVLCRKGDAEISCENRSLL